MADVQRSGRFSRAVKGALWTLAPVIAVLSPGDDAMAQALGQPPVSVAPADPKPIVPAFTATSRPRIGLVLSGGGAKGFAHIGVIEELERRHIPIDVISGTSMGAVVGSMYAIGNDAGEIKAIAREIDWQSIFNDKQKRNDLTFRRRREVRDILLNFRLRVDDGRPALPTGVLGGQRLFATVQELLAPWRAVDDFSNLPIPFRAVATDIGTGHAVVMDSGNLSTAVFSSMSIPAAFPPVQREGLYLVDGGISNNLPVDVARQMGVDLVIVVNVGEPPAAPAKIKSALNVLNQMQLLLGWEAIERQLNSLKGRDVLIEPDITGFGVSAFNRLEDGIDRGRAAAIKVGDKLDGLSVDEAQWKEYLAEREARANPAPIRVDRVEIVNTSNKVRTTDLQPLVTTKPGDMLTGATMKRDIDKIFKLDEFERVAYDINLAPDANTLVVNADGVRGASKYWMIGLNLASNFGKLATFDLALAYTDRDFLGIGAEWRGFARVGDDVLLDVNLYKQYGKFFVEPTAYFERYSRLIARFGSTETIDALQVSSLGTGVDGGLVFGGWGELRVGTRVGGLKPSKSNNDNIVVPPGWLTDIDWRVGFTADTLDLLTFPRTGIFARVQYIDHVTALGGNFTRKSFNVFVQKPISWGRATVVLGGRFGATTSASNDFIGDYQLGGFLNLSGTVRNSLIGQQLVLGRAVGYYRISDKAPILDLPIYVGGSIEAGNVWTRTSDISLGHMKTAVSGFIAADTPIGPIWFAAGQSGSNTAIYLILGRVF